MAFDGQTVQALVPLGSFAGAAEDLSTPISGATTLHVLTDRNLFQLSGFDATSLSRPIPVAPYGTLSPMSVGRSQTGFYWLDDRGQVCFFSGGGLRRLSVGLVDDITTTIPAGRKAWAWGACANDRYYLAYTPPGKDGNENILVWNERLANWESVDSCYSATAEVQSTAEALVPYYSEGYVKLLRFSKDAVYEHERPGCTNDVEFGVTFRAFHEGGLKQVVAGEMTVWAEGPPSGSYELRTRRTSMLGVHEDGTITVDATNVWMETAGKGMTSPSVQPSISGTVPGGTRFYSVMMKMDVGPSPAFRP